MPLHCSVLRKHRKFSRKRQRADSRRSGKLLTAQRAPAMSVENLPMNDDAQYRTYNQLEEFLQTFYSLSQTARIHNETHKLVVDGIEKLFESINSCMESDVLTVKISNGRLFIDDEKLSYNRTTKNSSYDNFSMPELQI